MSRKRYAGRSHEELFELLNHLADRYNQTHFIEADPISVPHRFSRKEDIEIAAFLTATIAWGNRKSILQSADRMIQRMGESPYDYVMEASLSSLKKSTFVIHRTFNHLDFEFFIRALRMIYSKQGGLEKAFMAGFSKGEGAGAAIHSVRNAMLTATHLSRSEKHLADPLKGSSAKRINMFLRWMVRRDARGVDFGLWKSISPSDLSIPLDVHTGNTSRSLGLLTRTANDWKAVCELDEALRRFDSIDPVRYDYALFGLGVDPELKG